MSLQKHSLKGAQRRNPPSLTRGRFNGRAKGQASLAVKCTSSNSFPDGIFVRTYGLTEKKDFQGSFIVNTFFFYLPLMVYLALISPDGLAHARACFLCDVSTVSESWDKTSTNLSFRGRQHASVFFICPNSKKWILFVFPDCFLDWINWINGSVKSVAKVAVICDPRLFLRF